MGLPMFQKEGVPTVTLSRGQTWPAQTSIETGQVVALTDGLRPCPSNMPRHAFATRCSCRTSRAPTLRRSGPFCGTRASMAPSSPLPGSTSWA